MDRVRTELYPPYHLDELRRQARRVALADEAARAAPRAPTLSARLGRLLVQVGCRLEATGRQVSIAPAQPAALDCGCPERTAT
jgi:hypothetical protein